MKSLGLAGWDEEDRHGFFYCAMAGDKQSTPSSSSLYQKECVGNIMPGHAGTGQFGKNGFHLGWSGGAPYASTFCWGAHLMQRKTCRNPSQVKKTKSPSIWGHGRIGCADKGCQQHNHVLKPWSANSQMRRSFSWTSQYVHVQLLCCVGPCKVDQHVAQ